MKFTETLRESRAARTTLIVLAIVLAMLLISLGAAFGGRSTAAVPTATATDHEVLPTAAPVYHPDGDALSNLALFNWTNQQTIAKTAQKPTGEDFINALVAAGFDRSKMQLTADTTAAGLQADSIQFSVQIGNECLIGQWGTGSDGYKVEHTNAIDGIGCLIGKTRPIDW